MIDSFAAGDNSLTGAPMTSVDKPPGIGPVVIHYHSS